MSTRYRIDRNRLSKTRIAPTTLGRGYVSFRTQDSGYHSPQPQQSPSQQVAVMQQQGPSSPQLQSGPEQLHASQAQSPQSSQQSADSLQHDSLQVASAEVSVVEPHSQGSQLHFSQSHPATATSDPHLHGSQLQSSHSQPAGEPVACVSGASNARTRPNAVTASRPPATIKLLTIGYLQYELDLDQKPRLSRSGGANSATRRAPL